jgi:hypothetical protein
MRKIRKKSAETRSAPTRSGAAPASLRLKLVTPTAARCSSCVDRPFHSVNAPPDTLAGSPWKSASTATVRCGSTPGNGLRTTAHTRLKMALVAPMPSASVPVAAAVNPGARRSCRPA